MPSSFDYACDSEFFKLMTRREDVDLTRVALELARDAYPRVDFASTYAWIDARVAELAGVVSRARSDEQVLRELACCIGETHGLFGDQSAYERADSSYLHRVIETRRGIPISLSLVYMAVAERLGIELRGVAAPMHFLVRYESAAGPLFLDAFGRGRTLAHAECVEWLSRMARISKDRIKRALEPVGPRPIVLRMLNNLKALHVQQEHWSAAWQVQHRLTALQPTSYQERRDLAVLSIRANRPGPAIDLLHSCLKACPSGERELLEQQLRQAEGEVHRWN